MARLVLLTPAELTRDPRARRAAQAAVAAGWEVLGLCPARGGSPVALDGVTVLRSGGEALDVALRSAGLGGGRRDSAIVREARGVYRLLRLARTTLQLWLLGRKLGSGTVVHANDFDTLPAGRLVAAALRARLVYDAHELYAHEEVDPPRLYRLLTGVLERALAKRADAVVTVSAPIADTLRRELGLRSAPIVVLNCPPRSERGADPGTGRPLRLVYQGAAGLARLRSDLFDAAAAAEGVHLTLRIAGTEIDALRAEAQRRGLEDRVTVLEPVDPAVLVDALTEFDIGLVVTRPLTLNDRLALPNKLFEYLMAGLAVVVPDMPGVGAIVAENAVGVTFEAGSPSALARVLTELAAAPTEVAAYKERARQVALERFSAEAQRPALERAWGVSV